MDAGELLRWIAEQVEPLTDAEPTLSELAKRELVGKNEQGRDHWGIEQLAPEDWVKLGEAWGNLPAVANVERSKWQQYLDAFASWKDVHPGSAAWELYCVFKDHRAESNIRRMNVLNRHHWQMDARLKSGEIRGLMQDRTPATNMQRPGVMLPVEQAAAYLIAAGFSLKAEPANVMPNSASEQPKQGALNDEDGERARRLDRFRSLGGKVSGKNGAWRFAGIKKLIDAEKAENRGRTSDKTIREDLRTAADAEADRKRAGLLAKQLMAGDSR